jgi:hypothetical protein
MIHARNTSSKQGLSEPEFLPVISFVEDVLQMSAGSEVNLDYQVSLVSSCSVMNFVPERKECLRNEVS